MNQVYNFGAGPAMLPVEVMQQAQAELLNWQNTGVSVMEVSHRSEEFSKVAQESEQDLRDLLNIPDHYRVLFLQGGGQSQFSMVPMNLLGNAQRAAYVDFGLWGKLALTEAKRYCDVNVVASTEALGYRSIIDQSAWSNFDDSAYLYTVDNETVNGVELSFIPETGDVPLVADMSSNLLSREFDINRYGLIFACSQKNLGAVGITIVIVHEELLSRSILAHTPKMFNYTLHAEKKSLLNTSPTFSWYTVGLVLKWLKRQGGVSAIEKINHRKSQKLYQYIDGESFYVTSVDPASRSRMNVVFELRDESLEQAFLDQAKRRGLLNLKGHRVVGGMRASLYNAMPEAGVDSLIDFMQEFAKNPASINDD